MKAWLHAPKDGKVENVFPYTSKMKELKPLYKVDPSLEITEERIACDKAFALACRYSGGRDLVKEMVASDFWPLGHRNEEFTIEMVQVPVFGPPKGIPFPQFNRGLPEDETKESFLDRVEASARRIVGKISEKEYVQRKTKLGKMPRFNRVFEELGIKHDEYVVPPDMLLSLEKRKDASKHVAAVESRKRRGGRATKALAKKRKAEVIVEVPIESSSDRSSAAESNSVESQPAEEAWAEPTTVGTGGRQGEVSRGVSSARLPFVSLLGEDSFDAEAPGASPPWEVPARGASPPNEGQDDSSEEAESASVRRIKKAVEPPQPTGEGINSLYMGKLFDFVAYDVLAYL